MIAPSVETTPARQTTDSSFIDVEAWAENSVVQAIDSLVLSSPPRDIVTQTPRTSLVRGTSVAIEIPLDETQAAKVGVDGDEIAPRIQTPQRELRRRDSLKRREALLKGKEGSRRRQRWENDRLLSNPHAEPPLPSDWEVRPTYPIQAVPYFIAPLWEAKYAARAMEKKTNKSAKRPVTLPGADQATSEAAGKVAKELRQKLKKSRAAKGLLQDLEVQVRQFVQKWDDEQQTARTMKEEEPDADLLDSESSDDEVVFVGRHGQTKDLRMSRKTKAEREKLVFDSLEEDAGSSFGRWLVHSIGTYYGLDSWSITVGNPARREAYVAIKDVKLKTGSSQRVAAGLPRPLYAIV